MFFDMLKYVYSESVFNTRFKTQMLKEFPSDKANGAKNTFFFLWRPPTDHSFTFNLQFLNELKHKVHLSKSVHGIFHFDSVSFLLKFLFNKT